MKKVLTALFLLAAVLLSVSCGEEGAPVEDTTAEDAVDETPEGIGNLPIEEIDIYAEATELKVGFVKQDHHSAVFVAALRSQQMHEMYPVYLVPLGESYYALIKDNEKIAEIEFVQSQGAINVPNNMQAGLFEVGFGGVTPFMSSIDQGNPISIIAPLHQEGDMLVVAADNETVFDWDGFVEWVTSSEEPITVGFKSPSAVALVIFQSALTEAGISFAMSGGNTEGAEVILYNAQGQPNLNPALQEGLIQAYISNNPACALAEHNGIGRCVAELSQLPPGNFVNHPCCAIAANNQAITDKPEEITALLELFLYSTEYINEYPEDAAAAAAEWIGTPVEVEVISMGTSVYDMTVTENWNDNMMVFIDHMKGLNAFSGPLGEADNETALEMVTDFSLLPQ